jgi:type I restriction enzyme R subunit
MAELQFFDREQDFTVAWRRLPHWSQAGTLCFITWRTADSLPKSAIERLSKERAAVLAEFGVRVSERRDYRRRVSPKLASKSRSDAFADQQPPTNATPDLSPELRAKLNWKLFQAWDHELDRAAGECMLARPELATIVADSLRHFDGERYILTDFIVMPNHVHVLAAMDREDRLLAQVTSWKRYSGRRIQQVLGRHGEFWQVEPFDHLVRSAEQFAYLRRYIAKNPENARLPKGTYVHYAKDL